MLKRKLIISIVLLMSSCASTDQKVDVFKRLDNATILYVCYYFFKERGESLDDILQKNKLNQVSESLLMQAQFTAKEAGGASMDKKVSNDAEARYKKFMNNVLSINTSVDRNKEISKFLKSCADISGMILRK